MKTQTYVPFVVFWIRPAWSTLEQGKKLQHVLLDRVAKFPSFVSLTGSGFRWVGRTPLPKFLLSIPPRGRNRCARQLGGDSYGKMSLSYSRKLKDDTAILVLKVECVNPSSPRFHMNHLLRPHNLVKFQTCQSRRWVQYSGFPLGCVIRPIILMIPWSDPLANSCTFTSATNNIPTHLPPVIRAHALPRPIGPRSFESII